jgi:hypothetical protein
VDRVLEAMAFGPVFWGLVKTLHRDVSASFLLHRVSRAIPLFFSVRQGDPLAMLIYNTQL